MPLDDVGARERGVGLRVKLVEIMRYEIRQGKAGQDRTGVQKSVNLILLRGCHIVRVGR